VAFDEELAERVREALPAGDATRVSERRMFGGLAFLLDGQMFVGIIGDELMVKLGAEGSALALRREHVREMDFTGRPAKGMVFVQPAGLLDEALARWVHDAAAFARGLPPKNAADRRRR
jgi:TfoX/Sxy family transcriptional regulator of competence genes